MDYIALGTAAADQRRALAAALLGLRWEPDVVKFSKTLHDELDRMGYEIRRKA